MMRIIGYVVFGLGCFGLAMSLTRTPQQAGLTPHDHHQELISLAYLAVGAIAARGKA